MKTHANRRIRVVTRRHLRVNQREPISSDSCKRFSGVRFRPRRAIRGPVDTREARAYPRQSRSIGLLTPSAPWFITWRYIMVVDTSRCPSSSCTVRMS